MSHDLVVWTVSAPELPATLPEPEAWQANSGAHVRPSRGCQVVLNQPDRVDPEDVPTEVSALLPGIGYRTELNVEPLDSPTSALKLAARAARAIAKSAHGVVEDLQDGSLKLGSGVKRYRTERREKTIDFLELTWWFTEGPLNEPSGRRAFLDALFRGLPEAKPKRYGLYEPPQHRLEETGLSHFFSFLEENLDEHPVWYPQRPVGTVSINVPPEWGVSKRSGFRCSFVKVTVERAALRQQGWQAALRNLWHEASRIIQPFYGEVRSLGGRSVSGAGGLDEIQWHPVGGGRWRGIPQTGCLACVLGPAYQELWPALTAAADPIGQLAFVSTEDWLKDGSITEIAGPVPKSIALCWEPRWRHGALEWCTEYSTAWPLGDRPPKDSR